MQPSAIGRIPPLFFFRATKEVPEKMVSLPLECPHVAPISRNALGLTATGSLNHLPKAEGGPSDAGDVAYLGHQLNFEGKIRLPEQHHSQLSQSVQADPRQGGGGGGKHESGYAGRCLTCRVLKVSRLKSSGVSSEEVNLIAPLKFPSSILLATLRARVTMGSGRVFISCLRQLVHGEGLKVEKISSWSCCITMFERDSVCFPLCGCLRHVEVNKKSLFHASIELLLTTSFRRVVSLELHNHLADFGI